MTTKWVFCCNGPLSSVNLQTTLKWFK